MSSLKSIDPSKREPIAIGRFLEKGHPVLAFIVAMSWLWRSVVAGIIAAVIVRWLA